MRGSLFPGPLVGLLIGLLAGSLAGCQGPAQPKAPPEGARLDPQLSRLAVERWGKRLLPVAVWLRKSEGEDPGRFSSVGTEHSERRPLEVAGLLVDQDTIWIPDLDLERRFIARITAGEPPRPATLKGALLAGPGWVIRTSAPLPGVDPIGFVPFAGGGEGLYALRAEFDRGGWVHILSKLGGDHRRLGKELWTEAPRGSLLLDKELRPVGYSLSGRLGLDGTREAWRGAEIAKAPVLDFEDLDRTAEALSRKLAPRALTVRGFYRREEDLEGRRGRRFRFRYGGDDEGRRNDFLATGYPVGPLRVLVNHALNRDTAMRLERLVVTVSGTERPARFIGALRRYHAFLAELEGDPLPEPLDLSSSAPLEISQPLLSFTADHRTGRRREILEANRVAGLMRGYKGVLEPVLLHFPRPATLLLGVDGQRLEGVVLEVNREGEDDEPHRSFRSQTGIDLRVLTPAQLQAVLEESLGEGKEGFDPRLVPRPVEREKDMVWLGVDFQPISRDLARSHGVEVPTRGGEVGLILLVVHPGSPAARAGLVPGDILLSIWEEDQPEPIELRAGGEFAREDTFHEMMGEEMMEGEDMPPSIMPPWRSPRNFLNERLTRMGEGRKVDLTYLRNGKEARVQIPLELAPPDFENSRKHKSEELGLTVKDLTYEVRSHYRLKEDYPGVVVAKVEPGSKANVAKVLPYEIVVQANGKVVRDVEDFRRALEEMREREAGERPLELKLERMGKSRLVRIGP